jgi:hypothetical protein
MTDPVTTDEAIQIVRGGLQGWDRAAIAPLETLEDRHSKLEAVAEEMNNWPPEWKDELDDCMRGTMNVLQSFAADILSALSTPQSSDTEVGK